MVQAHPVEQSYNAALLNAVLRGLQRSGVDPTVARICQNGLVTQSQLYDTEHLVMIYPTWWGTLPAALVDLKTRLIGDWVDGLAPIASSPIGNVKKLSVVVTHGGSKLMNRLQGKPGYKFWTSAVQPLCAPDASIDWIAIYSVDRSTKSARNRFLADVEETFAQRHLEKLETN